MLPVLVIDFTNQTDLVEHDVNNIYAHNKFCVLCPHEMLCHFKVTEMSQSSFDSKDLERSTPTNVKSLDRIKTLSTSNYVFAWFIRLRVQCLCYGVCEC